MSKPLNDRSANILLLIYILLQVDVTGLEKQIQEKKIIQEEENLRNEKFGMKI